MNYLRLFKLWGTALLLSGSALLACPGGCAQYTKGYCNGPQGYPQKICNKTTKPGMYGPGMGKGIHAAKHSKQRGYFIRSIKYALSHLGLSQGEWNDVKIAMRSYYKDIKGLRAMTPLESLQNGKFDKKLFLSKHPMHQKMLAQAELLETIFLILNAEQRKRFVMLVGADQHFIRIREEQSPDCKNFPGCHNPQRMCN